MENYLYITLFCVGFLASAIAYDYFKYKNDLKEDLFFNLVCLFLCLIPYLQLIFVIVVGFLYVWSFFDERTKAPKR